MKIGIDLGRTLKGPTKDLYNEPMENAFEVVSKLVKKYGSAYIISRVNSEQRERAIKWLEDQNFYNITGIPKDNVYYCFDRRDKALFVKALGINCFIDDRPDVLLPMDNKVKKILFNPSKEDLNKFELELNKFIIVKNWKEIEKFLLG